MNIAVTIPFAAVIAPTMQTIADSVLVEIVAGVTIAVGLLVAFIAARAVIEGGTGQNGALGRAMSAFIILAVGVALFIARDEIASLLPVS